MPGGEQQQHLVQDCANNNSSRVSRSSSCLTLTMMLKTQAARVVSGHHSSMHAAVRASRACCRYDACCASTYAEHTLLQKTATRAITLMLSTAFKMLSPTLCNSHSRAAAAAAAGSRGSGQ